jgi:hypothetical protein
VSATEEASDRQEPDPEPSGSDSSGEEASVEQDAPEDEGSPADEIPSADEDGAAVDEDGAAVEEGEAGPPDSSAEEDVAPPAADPPATEDEQATGSDREARDDELADANERRRREQLEERKQRRKDAREQARADAAKEKLAARDTASNGPTPKQADKKAAGPKGGEESESAAWNPWTSGGSAAPKPAAATSDKGTDPANPWGVGAPPTSKPAESARTRVSITTKPAGAKVKVAGTSRGASPVKMELPLGTHEIQVSKEGYLPGSRYVKVTDADPISISIALEPMASAAAKREGTLFISSSPSGALLYVDGSSKGRTPISVAVTEGAHSLKLVSDGRDPVEKRIRVNFARSTTVRRFIEIP